VSFVAFDALDVGTIEREHLRLKDCAADVELYTSARSPYDQGRCEC
jgi:hypothetical protein